MSYTSQSAGIYVNEPKLARIEIADGWYKYISMNNVCTILLTSRIDTGIHKRAQKEVGCDKRKQ